VRCRTTIEERETGMARARWVGVIAAVVWLAGAGMARANQLVTVTIPAGGDVASQWLDYPGPPRANVLLPTGYRSKRAYPLLVLLHGLESDYDWWATAGAQKILTGLDAIVVMPEGGSGWYTDWWNNGERGNPSWESYELDKVLPYVLDHYKVLPQRRYHAIAGVSMGGLGATYLGGRLPGFFGSVGTLSGFVDPQEYGYPASEGEPLTSLAPFKGDSDFDAVEGPPSGFYATGHNPTALVENLQYTRVYQTTGTGEPTSAAYANPGSGVEGTMLEGGIIYPMNEAYRAALAAAGVQTTYQVHAGGHDKPDFQNELKALLAWGLFKPVVSDPRTWTNRTVATEGQLWDVDYRFAKPPDAVVEFHQSGRALSISAAGSSVTLTTAAGCDLRAAPPATVMLPRRCAPVPNDNTGTSANRAHDDVRR
jgi:S-formylglutathione hydrolase FrmB